MLVEFKIVLEHSSDELESLGIKPIVQEIESRVMIDISQIDAIRPTLEGDTQAEKESDFVHCCIYLRSGQSFVVINHYNEVLSIWKNYKNNV